MPTLEAMTARPPRVVVLGDAITDVIVRLKEPIAEGSDTRAAIDVRPGGSGANQAAWLATQGLEVHFIGRVGRDAFGLYHLEELRRAGVIPHIGMDAERSTGTIVALVDRLGERSMLTDRGAIFGLRPRDLPTDAFREGDCFHLSGYMLFEPALQEVALAALHLARERGMITSLDPSSSALLVETGRERFLQWTRGCDLCFPNLSEGEVLTGEREPENIARSLCTWYGGVALKMGAGGAMWVSGTKAPFALPAEPIEIVDSTGAGDAFCAGFLGRWLLGAGPQEALANGIRLGAMAATRVGARPPSPPPCPVPPLAGEGAGG